jgi:MFS family permease
MLADEVEPSQFGRAYGVERSADMFGAVTGSLLAIVLFGSGVPVGIVILVSLIPSSLAAISFASMTRDRHAGGGDGKPRPESRKLPALYWRVLAGVFVFGIGDFSRTFLIVLAASAFGEHNAAKTAMSIAMLLYVGHNVVSGVVALPVGRLADRRSKLSILLAGFMLGAATNAMLAFGVDSTAIVVGAIALSGVYIAIQETVEKAVVAELLPREVRSLGLGVLAATNAVGDVVSSVYVGFMLDAGHPIAAFGAPAIAGVVATIWLATVGRKR